MVLLSAPLTIATTHATSPPVFGARANPATRQCRDNGRSRPGNGTIFEFRPCNLRNADFRGFFRLNCAPPSPIERLTPLVYGALAQLGERLHGMQEVRGSIPLGSTISLFDVEIAANTLKGKAVLAVR